MMKIFGKFPKKSNLLNSLLFVYMNRYYVGWIALIKEIKEYLVRIHVKCFDCGYDMDTLGLKLIHKGYLEEEKLV